MVGMGEKRKRIVIKITNQEAAQEVLKHKNATMEWYYECPACGHEPYAGVPLKEAKSFLAVLGEWYFCSKCGAITLVLTNRVRKDYADRMSTAEKSNHQNAAGYHKGGHVTYIKRMQEREDRGAMGGEVLTDTLYTKLQRIKSKTATRKL